MGSWTISADFASDVEHIHWRDGGDVAREALLCARLEGLAGLLGEGLA
jgi:hypothetical protein